MPFVREAFETLGETVLLDGRAIGPGDVVDADVLAIRSTTKVTPALLEGSRVRFVGTATIGTDHMDIPYLEQRGIHWCYAPGCNANSVAEYIAAALLCLGGRHGFALEGKTLGIVGVGNVGSRVAAKAQALGMRLLLNDPPRAKRGDKGWRSPGEDTTVPFTGIDALLAEADIVTMHVPLTRDGPDATRHMADDAFFARMRRGAIFINSARGPVVATEALLRAMDAGPVAHAVIDTWEGEPGCRSDILERVDLGTPHIAGYSYDGKVMGTVMVYREACRFLGSAPAWTPEALLPPAPVPLVELEASGRSDEDVLRDLVKAVYDIEADDGGLRATIGVDAPACAAEFDRLRKQYPARREFPFTRAVLKGASDALLRKARGLGFMTTP